MRKPLLLGLFALSLLAAGVPPALAAPAESAASKPLSFCISNVGGQENQLCLHGLGQLDYRAHFFEDADAPKNGFDIRRARLSLNGKLISWLSFKFEYEFSGTSSQRLMDAYADIRFSPWAILRLGQEKEPFGLEQTTPDKDLIFAERSMGFAFLPNRDVGLVLHGAPFSGRVIYGLGVMNGTGPDGSTTGRVDDPIVVSRVSLLPFVTGEGILSGLLLGGSVAYGRVDASNVELHVKTEGLTPFFDVASQAKFNVVLDAGHKVLWGAEAAYSLGPIAVFGEYSHLDWEGIITSRDEFDAEFRDAYGVVLWMITGEHPDFTKAVLAQVRPLRPLTEGGPGAIGLAARYDDFVGEKSVYDTLVVAGDSVREAKAVTVAANWWPVSLVKVLVEYTRTTFDQPLKIDRDPVKGTAIYTEAEDLATVRFQFAF
ncbi:MAG: porin [Thermodesulfobacteriota bacterium]